MRPVNIAALRQEYMRSGLTEADADGDPLRQFERWLQDAVSAGLPLPNAMTLCTVDAGAPSARIVLLKGLEQGGFVFYTNYLSRKGRELEAGASACLVFLWSQLERQVRIDCDAVERVSEAESDAYFRSRPLGARHSAWASPQSQAVASRAVLEKAAEEARRRHGEEPPRPPHWGGYRLRPREIEFWQGRADRLHDRLVYRRDAGTQGGKEGWRIERLAP